MWYNRGVYHVNPKSSGPLGPLGAGSTFGESVLCDAPRRSTVVTRDNCQLLRVEQRDFRHIWKRNKDLMEEIICNSAKSEGPSSCSGISDGGVGGSSSSSPSHKPWRRFSRRRRSAAAATKDQSSSSKASPSALQRRRSNISPTRASSSSPVRTHTSPSLGPLPNTIPSTLPRGFSVHKLSQSKLADDGDASKGSSLGAATPQNGISSSHQCEIPAVAVLGGHNPMTNNTPPSKSEASSRVSSPSKVGQEPSSRLSSPSKGSPPKDRSAPSSNGSTPTAIRRGSLARAASLDTSSLGGSTPSRKPSLRASILRMRCESQDTGDEDDDGDGPSPAVAGRSCRSRSQELVQANLKAQDTDTVDEYHVHGAIIKPNFLLLNGDSDVEGRKCRMNQERSLDLDSPSNAAEPIVEAPSLRIVEAAWVLRTMLLSSAPHLMLDHQHHGRTQARALVGTELTEWLMGLSTAVHSRGQATAMWQALAEEGALYHVTGEQPFRDKYLFYRFLVDADANTDDPPNAPTPQDVRDAEERLTITLGFLQQQAPDALLRMILRKSSHERTLEDQELIYEELLHLKALSHLSNSVKHELASVIKFESHSREGTVLFQQGSEGKSWYIILRGCVGVSIHGKGVVNTLNEGDDFGKLALVNDAPRAATIICQEDNCHFLRVDKGDFNRILRDVEANTVRLKEHGQDVLVLEKISSNTQSHSHYKYKVMAGTPSKMLEHLLETRLDAGRRGSGGIYGMMDLSNPLRRSDLTNSTDLFMDDFLLTHIVFMDYKSLTRDLLAHYRIEEQSQDREFIVACKWRVIHFVHGWVMNIREPIFKEPESLQFLQTLQEEVAKDVEIYGAALRDEAGLMLKVAEALERYERDSSAAGISKWKLPTNGRPVSLFGHSNCDDLPEPFKTMRAQDDSKNDNSMNPMDVPLSLSQGYVIFRVYCADHTYCTLRVPLTSTSNDIKRFAAEKLGMKEEKLLLVELKSTGDVVGTADREMCAPTGLSLNGRLFISHKDHLDALTTLPEQEGPHEGTISQLELYSTRELAYHITLHDWDLFQAIHEYEFLYQVFGRDHFGKVMCNLDVFYRRFNELQYWVVSEICLTTQLSKRAQLLRKFIKLAAYCKEQQNLNAFFAIVIGISNVAISRLTLTWERLPSRFRKMYTEFEMLIEPSRNHRLYRQYLAKLHPPVIPFTPLLMKDMTFTHEGNKTSLDGLINFEKMHMLAQTLRTIRYSRSKHLGLEVPAVPKNESEIRFYVRNIQVIDNQRRLMVLSNRLEPKRT